MGVKKSFVGACLPLLIISSLILSQGCQIEDTHPIRVATNLWPGYEPLYLARSLSLFDNASVQLLEFPNTTEVMRAYRNNVVDAAAVTLDESLRIAQYSNDFSIILVMDYSYGGDVIMARPPIANMRDIAGKKVGLENSALGSYFLTRALEISKISEASISILPLTVDEQIVAYDRKQIDVVVTFEPFRSRLIEKGARIIFDSTRMPGEIVDILIIRNNIIETRSEDVKEIIAGWFKALDYMKKNPGNSMRIISKRLGNTPEEASQSFSGLILPDREENRKMLFGSPPFLRRTIEKLHAVLYKNKILNKSLDVGDLLPSPKYMELYIR